MPNEEQNETEEQTPQRRSQTKRELDAFNEIVRVLRPINPDQRSRIIAAANEFLKE